jgi:hypothetical protein
MRRHFLTVRAVLPALTAVVSLTVVSVAGQTPATRAGASASSKASTSSKRGTVPRTPDGHPDLQGVWYIATLTSLERPAMFAGKATLTETEAKTFVANASSGGNQDAQKPGTGPYNRIISYNDFWLDRGSMLTRVNGEYRTAMVVDPLDGKVPPLTAEAKARFSSPRVGPGSADIGCYPGLPCADNPEDRPISERCLMGVHSAGPPRLPGVYGNFNQIVQANGYVTILNEMNHDARIIAFNRPHLPAEMKPWMGDSVAQWEGDTLVIDTTNIRNESRFRGASEALRVTERLTRADADTVVYRFTVDDPKTWTRPWTGEYAWVKSDQPVLEYACHEANYALGGILRGERMREKEAGERAQVKPTQVK